MRKNEFSSLLVNVSGRFIHPNGKEVRRFFEFEELVDILENECQVQRDFPNSLIDISSHSDKYQKGGIHQIQKKTVQGLDYFHFEVGFVHKDQEQLETFDTHDNKFEQITIDGNKYRHVRLHFTIIPKEKTIILDNKCFATITKHILVDLINPYVDPTKYGHASKTIQGILRINIIPVPKDDFEETLNRQFRNLKEVSMMFAKPSKLKMSALPEDMDQEEELDRFKDITESILEGIFEVSKGEITRENIPVKGIKITVQLDDEVGNATTRTQIKTKTRDFIKEYRDRLYTDDISFRYKSDGELERALLNSAKLTEKVNVDAKHWGNADRMWAEQRRAYADLKGRNLL